MTHQHCEECGEPRETCLHSRLLDPWPGCPDCKGSGQTVIQEVDIGVGFQVEYGLCECQRVPDHIDQRLCEWAVATGRVPSPTPQLDLGWVAYVGDDCGRAGEPCPTPDEAIESWLAEWAEAYRDRLDDCPCSSEACTCLPERLTLTRVHRPDHILQGLGQVVLDHLRNDIDRPEDCGDDWPDDGLVKCAGPLEPGRRFHEQVQTPARERLDNAITAALRAYLLATHGSPTATWWEGGDSQVWERQGETWEEKAT